MFRNSDFIRLNLTSGAETTVDGKNRFSDKDFVDISVIQDLLNPAKLQTKVSLKLKFKDFAKMVFGSANRETATLTIDDVISAARQDNLSKLSNYSSGKLDRNKELYKAIHYQNSSQQNGLRELTANALDSGTSPDNKLGFHGNGFLQSLLLLTSSGDQLYLRSKKDGEPAVELAIRKKNNGEFEFASRVLEGSEYLSSGTIVKIDKNPPLSEQQIKSLHDTLNDSFAFVDTGDLRINGDQVTPKTTYKDIKGAEYLKNPNSNRVNIEIDGSQITITDHGRGMSVDDIFTLLLTPKIREKRAVSPKQEQTPAPIIYLPAEPGNNLEKQLEVRVGGVLVERFYLGKGNFIDDLVINLSGKTYTPSESRECFNLDRNSADRIAAEIKELSSIKAEESLRVLNTLYKFIERQEDRVGTDYGLAKLIHKRTREILSENPDLTAFPSDELGAVFCRPGTSSKTILLDQKLAADNFDPAKAGFQRVENFVSPSGRILWVGDFPEMPTGKIPLIESGNGIFIDNSLYVQYKKQGAGILNVLLNPDIDYELGYKRTENDRGQIRLAQSESTPDAATRKKATPFSVTTKTKTSTVSLTLPAEQTSTPLIDPKIRPQWSQFAVELEQMGEPVLSSFIYDRQPAQAAEIIERLKQLKQIFKGELGLALSSFTVQSGHDINIEPSYKNSVTTQSGRYSYVFCNRKGMSELAILFPGNAHTHNLQDYTVVQTENNNYYCILDNNSRVVQGTYENTFIKALSGNFAMVRENASNKLLLAEVKDGKLVFHTGLNNKSIHPVTTVNNLLILEINYSFDDREIKIKAIIDGKFTEISLPREFDEYSERVGDKLLIHTDDADNPGFKLVNIVPDQAAIDVEIISAPPNRPAYLKDENVNIIVNPLENKRFEELTCIQIPGTEINFITTLYGSFVQSLEVPDQVFFIDNDSRYRNLSLRDLLMLQALGVREHDSGLLSQQKLGEVSHLERQISLIGSCGIHQQLIDGGMHTFIPLDSIKSKSEEETVIFRTDDERTALGKVRGGQLTIDYIFSKEISPSMRNFLILSRGIKEHLKMQDISVDPPLKMINTSGGIKVLPGDTKEFFEISKSLAFLKFDDGKTVLYDFDSKTEVADYEGLEIHSYQNIDVLGNMLVEIATSNGELTFYNGKEVNLTDVKADPKKYLKDHPGVAACDKSGDFSLPVPGGIAQSNYRHFFAEPGFELHAESNLFKPYQQSAVIHYSFINPDNFIPADVSNAVSLASTEINDLASILYKVPAEDRTEIRNMLVRNLWNYCPPKDDSEDIRVIRQNLLQHLPYQLVEKLSVDEVTLFGEKLSGDWIDRDRGLKFYRSISPYLMDSEKRLGITARTEKLRQNYPQIWEEFEQTFENPLSIDGKPELYTRDLFSQNAYKIFKDQLPDNLGTVMEYLSGGYSSVVINRPELETVKPKDKVVWVNKTLAEFSLSIDSLENNSNHLQISDIAQELGKGINIDASRIAKADDALARTSISQVETPSAKQRENGQNARYAYREKGINPPWEIQIDSYTSTLDGRKVYVSDFTDFAGTGLKQLVTDFIEPGKSTRDIIGDSLLGFGQGFYANFYDTDELWVTTCSRDKATGELKEYEIVYKVERSASNPQHPELIRVDRMIERQGNQEKTTIRGVKYLDDKIIPAIEESITCRSVKNELSGYDKNQVRVVHNQIEINDNLKMIAEVQSTLGAISISLGADKNRICRDSSKVCEMTGEWTRLVPDFIKKAVEEHGVQINFPETTQTTRTRTKFINHQSVVAECAPKIAELYYKAYLDLFIHEGIDIPGLPRDFFDSERLNSNFSDQVTDDALSINSGRATEALFAAYAENQQDRAGIFELLCLIEIRNTDGNYRSINDIRNNVEVFVNNDTWNFSGQMQTILKNASVKREIEVQDIQSQENPQQAAIDSQRPEYQKTKELALKFLRMVEPDIEIDFYYQKERRACNFGRNPPKIIYNLHHLDNDWKSFSPLFDSKPGNPQYEVSLEKFLNFWVHEYCHIDEEPGTLTHNIHSHAGSFRSRMQYAAYRIMLGINQSGKDYQQWVN